MVTEFNCTELNTYSSSFYCACRNNDVDEVKNCLKIISLDKINKIEKNGSTALHAASFYNHSEIVSLLLQYGAVRSQINKYKCTPCEEAKTSEIQKLFIGSSSGNNRFGGDQNSQIEWMLDGSNAERETAEQLQWYTNAGNIINLQCQLNEIRKDYLDKELSDMEGIQKIRWFINKAIEENDPVYLLKAYTAETDFYKILNKQLATVHIDRPDYRESWQARRRIVYIISCDPDLAQFRFADRTYRGMKLTENDLQQYVVGSRLMNKSFMSTSKDRLIAKKFVLGNDSVKQTYSTLCTYHIINNRSSLDLGDISEYADEREVVILPYCLFEVIGIKKHRTKLFSTIQIEIELKQCY
ncbi:unnamed protein product [Didymodactylos carnosus]|uniref:NAD(P)(+)--arginine ADP-ribosyltransferase n=1 Tax=Didymodactylos carnosus TaxID=1234261 RepID=A0A814YS11_9BILA|nr:unnamed protein product [Didymodactylos carnosus]CAF3996170.1 unnamed protein product [Didymodactylos carnosus]